MKHLREYTHTHTHTHTHTQGTLKNKKGITLVALVITIIILLILAGIAIVQLTKNGLLEKAKLAKQKTEEAQEQTDNILTSYQESIDTILYGKSRDNQTLIENGYYYVPIRKEKSEIISTTQTKILLSVDSQYIENIQDVKFYQEYNNENKLIYEGKDNKCYITVNQKEKYKFYAIAKYSSNPFGLDINETGIMFADNLVDYWPLMSNLNNELNSPLVIEQGTPQFIDGSMYLEGPCTVATANNYVMPKNFTILLQIKNYNLYNNGRGTLIFGQGSFQWNSSNTFGIHFDTYYPNCVPLSGMGTTTNNIMDIRNKNEWKTLGLTYDGTYLALYYDGKYINKTTGFKQFDTPLKINAINDSAFSYSQGYFRNFAIFNKALSNEEMSGFVFND